LLPTRLPRLWATKLRQQCIPKHRNQLIYQENSRPRHLFEDPPPLLTTHPRRTWLGGQQRRRVYINGGDESLTEDVLKNLKGNTEIEEVKENAKVLIDTSHQEEPLRGNSIFLNRIEREWLTTKEAAQFIGVSENALRIMAHRGQIGVFKFGRRLRFRLKDCAALFVKKGA